MPDSHLKPEWFKEHEKIDLKNFSRIDERLIQRQADSDANHKELMDMVKPLYDKFIFESKLDANQMANLGKWLKYLEIFLKVAAALGIIWVIFKFAIMKSVVKI